MFQDSTAFSGFSVDDIAAAKQFYGQILGLPVRENDMGMLDLDLNGTHVIIYPKTNHVPATYTVLNFSVDDIDAAVEQLLSKAVTLEHYDGLTDETGVARGRAVNRGPDIAWFKDPAGNVVSVLCGK